MARDILTGSRIRERRAATGLKQSELAELAGISASYLNLIEHNRRRIGGKVLLAISRALEVEPSVLTEGAETELIAALREAAALAPDSAAEVERIDEFAGRFPGWAALVAALRGRSATLEQTVEALTDRLTHDPHLATALHEMLSTVTAIRSTAAILNDSPDIEAEWRGRFHRNINEDAARLAESSTALVRYLEADEDVSAQTSPQEEVEAFLSARDHHFPELEEGGEGDVAALIEAGRALGSRASADMARRILERYRAMARLLPLEAVTRHLARAGRDPAALAAAFGTPLIPALHRLASLPKMAGGGAGGPDFGFVICDASGTLVLRKPIDHFPLPRFGAACALWPLFSALTRPGQPLHCAVSQSAREARFFECWAVAEPVGPPAFDAPPRVEAAMLFSPLRGVPAQALQVGVSCRICAREDCPARREPSVLNPDT